MLKRVFLLNMLFFTLAILLGVKVGAAEINISGKVTAAVCTVSATLSGGQTVNLGILGRTQFQYAASASGWKSFALNLTDCPAGTTQSTAAFSGTPDSADSTLFANTEPLATAATHVAVQMAQDADRSIILSNNATMTVSVNSSTGTASFPLAARLYTPTGGVMAGQVTSSVMVSFTYQ